MAGSAYIRDGRISRSKPSSTIYWSRCLVIFAMLEILIVTNPANGFGHWIPDQYWNTFERDTSWLGSLFRPQDTNYGLFLLTKTIDGISVTGLLNTFGVCDFDSEDELIGHVCGWIDDTFCHGKPLFDWSDLPYTTNRLLCWILIGVMLVPVFADTGAFRRPRNTLMDALTSVLDEPTIWDLIQVNLIVYPTLVSDCFDPIWSLKVTSGTSSSRSLHLFLSLEALGTRLEGRFKESGYLEWVRPLRLAWATLEPQACTRGVCFDSWIRPLLPQQYSG